MKQFDSSESGESGDRTDVLDWYSCKYLEKASYWNDNRTYLIEKRKELDRNEQQLNEARKFIQRLEGLNCELDKWCQELNELRRNYNDKESWLAEIEKEIEKRRAREAHAERVRSDLKERRKESAPQAIMKRIAQRTAECMSQESKPIVDMLDCVLSECRVASASTNEFEIVLDMTLRTFENGLEGLIDRRQRASKPREMEIIASRKKRVLKLSKTRDTSIPLLFLDICEKLVLSAEECALSNNNDLAESYMGSVSILLQGVDELETDTALARSLKMGRK